ncbi:MAG: rhomboid family intramembrane serine protease [Leptospiraceae bacterium]|nr:rhomboid family intramembrane serine protease [Leptospiraceae bacterium]
MNRQYTAPVTTAILVVNTLVFLLIAFQSNAEQSRLIDLFGLSVDGFFQQKHFWQPLTSMFMHQHPIHFFVNMLALWSIGTPIEITVGRARFTWLYFISGFAGAAFMLLFPPAINASGIGASGAISGLVGALAVFYPRATLLLFFVLPMPAWLLAVLFGGFSLFAYIQDFIPFMGHMAHFGGLVGGVAYSFLALGLKVGGSHLVESPYAASRSAVSNPFGNLTGKRKTEQQNVSELIRKAQQSYQERNQQDSKSSGGATAPGSIQSTSPMGTSSLTTDQVPPISPADVPPATSRSSSGSPRQPNPGENPGDTSESKDNNSTGSDSTGKASQKGRLKYDPQTGHFYYE